jgi:hypothetical protein
MKLFRLLFMGIVFLSLFSCAGQINGSISADGSALMSVSVSLEPRMTVLIRSLSAAAGQSNGPVINGPSIAQSMAAAPGIASVILRNTSPSAVEGAVGISRINDFLAVTNAEQDPRRRFIVFEQGTSGRCIININRDNGPLILELLSPEISDYLNALMAPIATGEDLTKNEYLELVASFYNRGVRDEISGSRIRASIDFPGQVTGIRGGTFSDRRAEFDIPLLDLLVLETPLVYEVSWR